MTDSASQPDDRDLAVLPWPTARGLRGALQWLGVALLVALALFVITGFLLLPVAPV